MNHDRPRKVFAITPQGSDLLVGTEQSFRTICIQLKSMGIKGPSSIIENKNNIPTSPTRL